MRRMKGRQIETKDGGIMNQDRGKEGMKQRYKGRRNKRNEEA